jgi:hypothetical protein
MTCAPSGTSGALSSTFVPFSALALQVIGGVLHARQRDARGVSKPNPRLIRSTGGHVAVDMLILGKAGTTWLT